MNAGLIVLAVAALLLEHYVFSFQRFTLRAARQCGAMGHLEEGQLQILMSPRWMGLLAYVGTASQLLCAVLFWRYQGWLVAVGYAAVAFFLFGVFVPLFPFLGHYRRIAGNELAKSVGGHQAEVLVIQNVLDHIEEFS